VDVEVLDFDLVAAFVERSGKDFSETARPFPDYRQAARIGGTRCGAARILRAVTPIYVLDGRQIRTLEDFWRVIGEAINGPGGYFGQNLDSFADCLSGGFGAPHDDDYVVEWRDYQVSREYLGYPETARQLEIRLSRCHATNRPSVGADLAAAKEERGTTVFDWVKIFEERAPGVLRLQ
jgi:RNAse (barnase) inhibitor barstar